MCVTVRDSARLPSFADVSGVVDQPNSNRKAVKAKSALRPSGPICSMDFDRRLNSLLTRSIGLVVRSALQYSRGKS